jgi:hypothetical protein
MGGEYRQVNGHNFITPIGIPSAHANTSVFGVAGFGVLKFSGPSYLTPGSTRDFNIFFYGQGLGGQIGILNRVAIEIGAVGAAAVSGDLDGLLSVGAITNVSAHGFPKVRIFTLDKIGLTLTVGAGFEYSKFLVVQPGKAVDEALKAAAASQDVQKALAALEGNIVKSADDFRIAPAVMLSEGVGPFGLQIAIHPNIAAYSSDADKKRHSLTSGAHVNFDIGYFTRYFPVAITAEYVNGYEFTSKDVEHTVHGGLWYSGRRDFSMGAAASYNKSPDVSIIAGQLGVQYFF